MALFSPFSKLVHQTKTNGYHSFSLSSRSPDEEGGYWAKPNGPHAGWYGTTMARQVRLINGSISDFFVRSVTSWGKAGGWVG